jgi:hypothetical protein
MGIFSAHKQHELLATKAERMNLRVRLERFGHGLQHGVADHMAVNIIDCLEVV